MLGFDTLDWFWVAFCLVVWVVWLGLTVWWVSCWLMLGLLRISFCSCVGFVWCVWVLRLCSMA